MQPLQGALGGLLKCGPPLYELVGAVILPDEVAARQVSVLVAPVDRAWHVEHLGLVLAQQPPAG